MFEGETIRRWLGALFAAAWLLPAGLAAAESGPPLPFEDLRRAHRGDDVALRYNDPVGRVPASRIDEVPNRAGRMGDRLILTDGVALYFPFGAIVASYFEIDKYAPRDPDTPAARLTAEELEISPAYGYQELFDNRLGPACARLSKPGPGDEHVEMRISDAGTYALVFDLPGKYDSLTGEQTRSYRIKTALSPDYLETRGLAEELLRRCGRSETDGKDRQ